MFERFTDRARRVVVLAQEEARTLHHSSIGTEHLLLGLIHEQDGLAAKALAQLGISLEVVWALVRANLGDEAAADEPSGHIPFTPRSKKVLELSLREALQLGHNYIGTEHILLGLIREGRGVGATVLTNLGADLDAVRTQVIRLMASAAAGGPLAPPGLPGRMSRTPAAAQAEVEARRLAAGSPVGSQHLLLAMVQQQDSMAAKALEGLGVTAEALRDRLARIEPAGTSDETPEEAGARRVGLRVEGSLVLLEIDDPDLAASLEKAMTARKVRVIRGTDPEAEGAGFPNVWSAVARSIDDMTRRLGKVVGAAPAAKPVPAPDWRPPALDPSAYTARYWMVSTGDGTSGSLEVGPGAGREAVRAFLRSWLAENRSSLAPPGASDEVGGAAVLWLAIDAEGDSFTMTDVGFGPGGPPRSRPVPMGTLVDAAVADLSAVT